MESSSEANDGLRRRYVAVSGETLAPENEMVKTIKKLDVFTKLPDDCKNSGTASGAGIGLVTTILVLVLVWAEITNYMERRVTYNYSVDADHNSSMYINIDMVIATPCQYIGFDILDITGAETHGHGQIEEIPTKFELDDNIRSSFRMQQHLHESIRSHHHSLQTDLFSSYGYRAINDMYDNDFKSQYDHKETSACRFKGRYKVEKVAGNMHVTLGKPVNFAGQHAHFQVNPGGVNSYNFSHRIYHLSFGTDVPGRINALDAEEKVTSERMVMYQYFLQAVPTVLDPQNWRDSAIKSYQYAVQEQMRVISHDRGSHGIPGIFFKFDVSPLQIRIKDSGESFVSFLTNLAAIVGGVCATSAVICYITNSIVLVIYGGDRTVLSTLR